MQPNRDYILASSPYAIMRDATKTHTKKKKKNETEVKHIYHAIRSQGEKGSSQPLGPCNLAPNGDNKDTIF